MAENEPQASGSGDSKFNAPAQQEPVQEQDVEQGAEVKTHPSSIVESTTTTNTTMDVNGKPTAVQETVTTKPRDEKPEVKAPADNKPEDGGTQSKTDKAKGQDKDEFKNTNDAEEAAEKQKKKRHWMLEQLDETMAKFREDNKPQDFMIGFKLGYETVAGLFIVAEKLTGFFGPKPVEAGITLKQGTVAGLHGKEGGTFKMLENAGVSANKAAPGQQPKLGMQVKNAAQGVKQGVQAARRSAAPGKKM